MSKNPLRDLYVMALETENETLRERVVQLEREIGLREAMPLLFGLTPSESRILSMLVRRGSASKEQLLLACTNDITGNKAPEIKIVDVYVHKIRRKLERFGIVIETVWGRGYNLDADNRAKVNAYLDASSGHMGVHHETLHQPAQAAGRLHAAGAGAASG